FRSSRDGKEWTEILGKTKLEGHSVHFEKLAGTKLKFIKVKAYPDGGFTRLGLFEDEVMMGESGKHKDPVPATKKPLSLPIHKIRSSKNLCTGGKILKAGNEHYSPTSLVISPYPAIHMFDGLENARSRTPGHFEEVEIGLSRKAKVKTIEFDFTHYVNNNPMFVAIEANGKELVKKTFVKPFAANKKIFKVDCEMDRFTVKIYPDGGINRIRVYE